MHVRDGAILFCFSTLKLKYFAYSSFQPFAYDKLCNVKHYISIKINFCNLPEVCYFLSGDMGRGLRKISENGNKRGIICFVFFIFNCFLLN